MKIKVFSRDTIENHHENNDHIFISIKDPDAEDTKLNTNEHTLGILIMQFLDVDLYKFNIPQGSKIYPEIFTQQQAKDIISFVKKHTNLSDQITILVNCEVGISRSPSIAMALGKVFEIEDIELHSDYDNIRKIRCDIPNMHIYNTIVHASNE